MGTDKASLLLDGVSMQDRVLAAVAGAGITNVIVAGTKQAPDAVAGDDQVGSQGPLAGIVGAWNTLRLRTEPPTDPIVVLACDLPWLVASVIRQLMADSRRHSHGAVAHDGDRAQPLVAAYRPVALDAMATSFQTGERSVRRCSAGWDLGVVNADPGVIADVDKPSDLAGFAVEWPS